MHVTSAEHRVATTSGTREYVDTVVVGGGQAGLAAGYFLKRRDIPFVIVDAHPRIGDAWRKRWDSLRLFTPGRYNGLPGMPFPGPASACPSKDEVADYLEAYASAFHLPVRTGVEVERLFRDGDRFQLNCGTSTLSAEHVIVASGSYHRPRIPQFASNLDEHIIQLHSKQYRNPRQLQDGPVLVVGAGNSGAEIALDVVRTHETWLAGRDTGHEPTRAGSFPDRLLVPFLWFAATRVIRVDRSIGRKVRDHFTNPPRGIPLGRVRPKDFAAAGIERVPRVEGVRNGYPLLENGEVLRVANVVWCTGFTPGFDWMDLPIATLNGIPHHDRGIVESCPGLYLLGLPFLYSLSSALVGGVGRDAEHIVEHLAATRREGMGSPSLM